MLSFSLLCAFFNERFKGQKQGWCRILTVEFLKTKNYVNGWGKEEPGLFRAAEEGPERSRPFSFF
jgi:hypothetical protein